VIFASIFLGEEVGWDRALGSLVTVGGVALVARAKTRENTQLAAAAVAAAAAAGGAADVEGADGGAGAGAAAGAGSGVFDPTPYP